MGSTTRPGLRRRSRSERAAAVDFTAKHLSSGHKQSGTASDSTNRASGRSTRFATLAIGIAASLLLLWVPWGSPQIGAFSDSIEYIILAPQLRGLFDGGDHTLLMHTRLPAGFSAWLALAGADVAHAARAHWMSWLAFAWALVAFASWLGHEVRGRAAIVVTALTIALPGFLLIALNPVSESLFAALIATALLGAVRRTPSPADSGLRFAGALAAALLPLVRTAGLPLTLAYAAWQWHTAQSPRGLRAMASALAILLPGLIWHGWRATLPIRGAYSSSFEIAQLRERFGSIGEFVQIQILAIPDALTRLLDPEPGAVAWAIASVGLILGAIGWWRRWRTRKLDAWLLPPALGILQIWPWPNEYPRMLWPVLPLLAVSVWEGVIVLRERWPQAARVGAPLFALLLAMCVLAAWAPLAVRMTLPVPVADRPFQRQAAYLLADTPQQAARIAAAASALNRAVRALPDHIARGECVYAIAAEAVWLGSGGRVVARHFDQRIDPAAPLPPQLPGCRFVLAAQLTSPQFPQLPSLFPLAVAEPWADVVLRADFAAGAQRQTAAVLLRQREWPAIAERAATAGELPR